jgi:hypothetical protein
VLEAPPASTLVAALGTFWNLALSAVFATCLRRASTEPAAQVQSDGALSPWLRASSCSTQVPRYGHGHPGQVPNWTRFSIPHRAVWT